MAAVQPKIQFYADKVQTTDANPTSVLSFATPSDSSGIALVYVSGRDLTSGDCAGYVRGVAWENTGGTVAVIAPGTALDHTAEEDGTWDVGTSVSTDTVSIDVTGDGTNNVDWNAVALVVENETGLP
jgi:hypothetical protein